MPRTNPDKIKVRNDLILIEKVIIKGRESIIELPQMVADRWHEQRCARVLDVGPKIDDLEKGDIIRLSTPCGVIEEWVKKHAQIIRYNDVDAKIEIDPKRIITWTKQKAKRLPDSV